VGSAQETFKGPNGKSRRTVSVSVKTAEMSPIEEKLIVNGTLVASSDIEIRNEIAGRIIGVHFKEGQTVKKGQLLIALNDHELQAQLLKATSNCNLMKDKEQRQKGLFEKQIISSDEYQTSLNNFETAEADMQILKAQLEKTKITAPFTGKIGLSDVREGAFLSAGSKICNFVSIDNLQIESAFTERYAPYLKIGMKFTFTLSDNPLTYNAEIIAIEPKIDESTRSVSVKAKCLESDERLIAGMFVKILIIINQHNGILVPGDALISDIEGYKLYTVKENTAIPVLVKTGFRDEINVEIISGLKTGDKFITSGAFMLRPGSKIEIQGAPDSKQSQQSNPSKKWSGNKQK
jgi:membrane fusion protein, multidrug efflux system